MPAGWDLISATCDDGSAPGSIGLSAGETVTCTFTNTKRGKIIVDKVTVPSGDPQSFDFTSSYGSGSFSLTDAATPNDSGALLPASENGENYSVTEDTPLPTGWTLTDVTCTGAEDRVVTNTAIDLQHRKSVV